MSTNFEMGSNRTRKNSFGFQAASKFTAAPLRIIPRQRIHDFSNGAAIAVGSDGSTSTVTSGGARVVHTRSERRTAPISGKGRLS
jgi:hypothetical protein